MGIHTAPVKHALVSCPWRCRQRRHKRKRDSAHLGTTSVITSACTPACVCVHGAGCHGHSLSTRLSERTPQAGGERAAPLSLVGVARAQRAAARVCAVGSVACEEACACITCSGANAGPHQSEARLLSLQLAWERARRTPRGPRGAIRVSKSMMVPRVAGWAVGSAESIASAPPCSSTTLRASSARRERTSASERGR